MQLKFKKWILRIIASVVLTSGVDLAVAIDKDTSENAKQKPVISLQKRNSLYVKPSDHIFSSPVSYGLIHDFLSGLTVNGYYRGYFYSRRMTHPYGNNRSKVMGIGDGYFDPGLLLSVSGNPTPNTSFGTEILVLNPFETWLGPGYTNSKVMPYFNMALRGGFKTKIGYVNVVAGGIEWLRLTPFTFGSNVGFNRYSIFERRPWDPVGTIKTRYASYYYNGTLDQDARWGMQAFKGFALNSFLTKINSNIDFFYGRTQFTGGIQRENIVRPSSNLGIRFKKNINANNYVSLNTFNSFVKSDSVDTENDVQWNIFTSEYQFKKDGFMLAGEIGMGRYVSPTFKEAWSPAILADLFLPKKVTFLPLSLRYFQIGQSFTSNVANFTNSSIREVNTGYKNTGTSVLTPFGGNMENVGDLNNNRRGFALNGNGKVGKLIFTFGAQVSKEMSRLAMDTIIHFTHRINNLVWSRLPGVYPLVGTFGPNNRVGTFYRGAYETVIVSDRNPDNTSKYLRYYNSLDLQLKYKTKLFNKELFVNYLGTFNSVGNYFRPVTSFGNDAYIRAQYHEAEIYYQILPELILSFYAGLEKIKGNDKTDYNPLTKGNRDQTGQALGVGFDFSLSTQTTLFFRQRWFSFIDKNSPGEEFNGNEATIELKIFF